MIEIPGRIPLSIHPFFWLFASLIGWLNSGTLLGTAVWVFIIVVSVLIHEYGHALTAIVFKQKTRIRLVALGGLTQFEGPKLKFWQQFIITFNGPLFGFFLFLAATYALQFSWSPIATMVLKWTQFANLFWTCVNLLPVLPLDGGQLLRIVLEGIFGVKGFKASLLLGAVFSGLISLYFFMVQAFLLGAFFFLFAFQSLETWRQSRYVTHADRDENVRKKMNDAETALQKGERENAKALFEEIFQNVPEGLFHIASAQYLAFFLMKEGKHKEAYDYLLPIKTHLSDDALCVLHELAAEEKNYALVADLSARCYQIAPTLKAALNNAKAFAYLRDPKLAGGWLQTALQYGGVNLEALLKEEAFSEVKNDPAFKDFFSP